jgi:uncharacterized protein
MSPKLRKLKEIIAGMKSVLVAYSGGVDSTFLLKVARDVLGSKVLAVTASSPTYPSYEIEAARRMAKRLGARHLIVKTYELSDSRFTENSPQRCYWCKRELFLKLERIAKQNKLNYVLDGSNYDDTKDFRPGSEAAREMDVISPLKEAGFSKDEIRSFSRQLGLPTWSKPSFACLASRFPYGTKITRRNLISVDKAERLLREFGLTQVRVRHHSGIARIEVLKEEIPALLKGKFRDIIVSEFKKLGYDYVTVDLAGYRSGSMNLYKK